MMTTPMAMMTGWPLNILNQIPGVFQVFPGDFTDFPGVLSTFSTMVGENFGIYLSLLAKNALKFSTMVGENYEIHISEVAKNEFK